MLAAVSWDGGGGDLAWSNPLNWSSDQLPSETDDVAIDAGASRIEYASGNTTINSLTLKSNLLVEDGLLLTSTVSVQGGRYLQVSGENSEFSSAAASSINGADLLVSDGGALVIGSVQEVSNSSGDMVWRATGPGSVLSLPNLTAINNGTEWRQDIFLEAKDGGELLLPQVSEIIDPNSGDQRGRSIQVLSDGVDSRVDLSSLRSFLDYSSGSLTGGFEDRIDPEYSRLTASQGGEIVLSGSLTTRGVYIPLDASGTIDTTTFENLRNSRLDISNAPIDLSSLTSAVNTGFNITGVDVDLSSLTDADLGWFSISGVDIDLTSITDMDGRDIYISGGVAIELPGVSSSTNLSGDMVWRATGTGSVLSLPNLTAINNGTEWRQDIFLEAKDGGELLLPQVSEIIDPNSGDQRGRSIQVLSDGVDSRVDLSSLRSFLDYSSGSLTGGFEDRIDPEYSRLTASQGGEIVLSGSLTTRGVYIPLDASGTIDTTTFENLRNSRLDISNAPIDLSSLTSAVNTGFNITDVDVDLSSLTDADLGWFSISGVDIDLTSVTDMDGRDIYISGGVAIELPGVSSSTNLSGDMVWRATGTGSVLSLPNLTAINNGTEWRQDIFLEAKDGGELLLPQVSDIIDPNSGDQRGRSIQVLSDGLDSRVDLSSLRSFLDYSSGSLTGGFEDRIDPEYSRLTASQGGEIALSGSLTTRGVYIPLDASGTIDTTTFQDLRNSRLDISNAPIDLSSLTSAVNTGFNITDVDVDLSSLTDADLGWFSISGVDIDLTSVTDMDGRDIYISGGVAIELPGVSSSTNLSGDMVWRATGTGSVLSLPNLTAINNGTEWRQDIFLEAKDGGELLLPQVSDIIDPNSGDQRGRSIQVLSDGLDSRVDLSSLRSFLDYSSGSLTGGFEDRIDPEYSRLTASQGGEIALSGSLTTRGVYIPLDASGTIDTTTFQDLRNSRLDISNAPIDLSSLTSAVNTGFNITDVDVDLSSLTDADLGWFSISGVDIDLTSVTDMDGRDIYISGGVAIELPGVSSSTNLSGDLVWRATGTGSVLSLPNLTAINNGTESKQDIFLEAKDGGELLLPQVSEIIDPNSGDQRGRSIQVLADGVDSRVDLSSLRSFLDYSSGSLTGGFEDRIDPEYSRLTASQGGEMVLGHYVTIRGVYVPLGISGRLLVGTLDVGTSSLLVGSGTIYGNLNNRASISIDRVEIHGDFAQLSGSLKLNLSGEIDSLDYSLLRVRGAVKLGGALEVTRDGFEPDAWSDISLIQADGISGEFDTVSGLGELEPPLEVVYGSSSVVLSRQFDRDPVQVFPYINDEPGKRVFFNVLENQQDPVGFRLVDPNGNFVFASQAIPSDPDQGDFGPFRLDFAGNYEIQVFAHPDSDPLYSYEINDAPIDSAELLLNRSNSGAIDHPGELDIWRLNAKQAAIYELEMLSVIGEGPLELILQAEDGRTVFVAEESVGMGPRKQYAISINQPGQYTLRILGRGDDTANYQFVMRGPESPHVISSAVTGNDDTTVDTVVIAFNQEMDSASFDLAEDLISLSSGTIPISPNTAVWVDGNTLAIEFDPQDVVDPIVVSLSAEINSLTGVPLDQDQDGNVGEPLEDRYTATIYRDQRGPRIFLTDPQTTASAPIDELTFYFSEPIDVDTFTQEDILGFQGPAGSLLNQITGVQVEETRATMFFESQILSGQYAVTIGADIRDTTGNLLDQNEDGVGGQSDDIFTATIVLKSPDLVVTSVRNPVGGLYGEEQEWTWTVTNEGSDPAEGLWWDYLYLSEDNIWDLDDALIARVPYDSAASGVVAANGGEYTGSITAPIPAVLPGKYHVLVRSNLLSTIAESDFGDNASTSSKQASFDIPTLESEIPVSQEVEYREAIYYKIEVTEEFVGGALVAYFSTENTNVANEMYMSRETLPSRREHDLSSQRGLVSNHWIVESSLEVGTYYIAGFVAPNQNQLGLLGNATVEAKLLKRGEFAVLDTDFGKGGTAGNRTIEINGGNFDRSMEVFLNDGLGNVAIAESYYRPDSKKLYATFDLTSVQPGTYDVVVANSSSLEVTIVNSFEVVLGGGSVFAPTIASPPAFRRPFHSPFVHFPVTVSWGNTGLNDIAVPLTVFTSSEPFAEEFQSNLSGSGYYQKFNGTNVDTFFAYPELDEMVPGLLLPGQSGSKLYQVVPRLASEVRGEAALYAIDVLYDEPEELFNWEAERDRLDRGYLTAEQFTQLFDEFQDSVGLTVRDYNRMLLEMAFVVPELPADVFEATLTLTQEAFDRHAATSSSSIQGIVDYGAFDIDLTDLIVTARNANTLEAFSAPVRTDGVFSLVGIGDGTFELSVTGGAVVIHATSVEVAAGEPASASLQIAIGSTVSGSVLGTNGQLLDDLRLSLTSELLDQSFLGEIDDYGIFQFADLLPGEYTLTATAPGWETAIRQFSVGFGEAVVETLELATATRLTGSVQSATGLVSDAQVRLLNYASGEVLTVFSQDDGNFSFNGVSPGLWAAGVTHPDFRVASRDVDVRGPSLSESFDLSIGATVTGRIVSEAGVPVEGAVVGVIIDANLRSVVTDSDGKFTVAGLEPGEASLQVDGDGFARMVQPIGDTAIDSPIDLGDVTLADGFEISVNVTDSAGAPIADATVMLQSNAGNEIISVATNDAGSLNFSALTGGVYRLSIGVDGYASTSELIYVSDGGLELDIQLATEATLTGFVAGVTDGVVALYLNEQIVRWAPIDSDGTYSIDKMVEGDYVAAVVHASRLYESMPIAVTAGSASQLNFAEPTGTIAGTATDISGQPLVGATITTTIVDAITNDRTVRTVITGDNGAFLFVGTRNGTETLTLLAEGVPQTSVRLTTTSGDHVVEDIAAASSLMLGGLVQDAQGLPISGASVFLVNTDFADAPAIELVADATGVWLFQYLAAGNYEIIVTAEGMPAHVESTTIASNTLDKILELGEQRATLTGIVSSSGLPLANALVTVSLRGVVIAEAVTNSDGSYSIQDLPTALVEVAIQATGTVQNAQSVNLGTSTDVSTELSQCNSCRVFLVAPSQPSQSPPQRSGSVRTSQTANTGAELDEKRLQVRFDRREELNREYSRVTSIPWEPIPSDSIQEATEPDCFCNSSRLKSEYDFLLAWRRVLHLDALALKTTLLGHQAVDLVLRKEAYKQEGHASAALFLAVGIADEYAAWALLLAVPATGGASGIASLLALLLTEFYGTLTTVDRHLNRYSDHIRLIEINRNQFNGKSEAFTKEIENYTRTLVRYERDLASEKQNCPKPSAPGGSETIPKGAGLSYDLLTADDRVALAKLKANGISWYVEVISNPSGSGVTISPNGGADIGDGDCDTYSIFLRLVLICDDSGIFGIGKEKEFFRGVFTLTRTPQIIPFNIFCGAKRPEDTDCYKYVVAVTGDCGAYDPNDILGPTGFGEQNWTRQDVRYDYTIRFENDAEEATAPAAVVTVTQQLDDDLDYSTFKLGPIGFGDNIIASLQNDSSSHLRLDYTQELGIFLDVSAGIDVATGQITFQLKSIDPETGEVPFSPLVGLLPPNLDGSEGQGFASYSIRTKANVESGTVIDAIADIIFDQNEAIVTPPVFNTIDAEGPTSSVNELAAESYPGVLVQWVGDDFGGSGVRNFDVFVSRDNRPFELWLDDTAQTEARFYDAVPGSTYAFYSVATDNVGYIEPHAVVADTTTTILEPARVVGISVSRDRSSMEIEFSQAMNLGELVATDAIATAFGIQTPDGTAVTLEGLSFDYDSVDFLLTASWDEPLTEGRYHLMLDAQTLTNENGGQLAWGVSGPSFSVGSFESSQPVIVGGVALHYDGVAVPSVIDFNQDGRLDLVVSTEVGPDVYEAYLLLNEGSSAEPLFTTQIPLLDDDGPLQFDSALKRPLFVDWTGDGALDLIASNEFQQLMLWTNVNTNIAPIYSNPTPLMYGPADAPQAIDLVATALSMMDINQDGRLDLLIATQEGQIVLFTDANSDGQPRLEQAGPINVAGAPFAVPTIRTLDAVDLNQDGNEDLLVTTNDGRILYYPAITNDPTTFLACWDLTATEIMANQLPTIGMSTATGDMNGDGFPDLLFGFPDGTLSWAEQTSTRTPLPAHAMANADPTSYIEEFDVNLVSGPFWQNPLDPYDVNVDGDVKPIDALIIINYLNRNGSGQLAANGSGSAPPPYYDVNGDDRATPIDALIVINFLNRGGNGEGEAVSDQSLQPIPFQSYHERLMKDDEELHGLDAYFELLGES
ncbi:carboxypeptidase regulatory-like domain-containing protein [Planctomycetaceae bacterium SH139]